MKLYGYWRSGASYRLRCALELKGLGYETHPVNLAAGEQLEADYLAVNPLGLVPTLELAGGHRMTGSEAIIEWLEESHPEPALLPENPLERQAARAFAHVIGAGVQPFHNLRVLKYLKGELSRSEDEVAAWIATWVATGLAALEKRVAEAPGPFLFGERPGIAECYLVPQLYSARRFEIDLAPYPTLLAADAACAAFDAFRRAHPDAQADAPAV